MRTLTLTNYEGNPVVMTLQYPNSVAFMYSRQPVIVEATEGAENVASVQLTVTALSGGQPSHVESRVLHEGRAEFDISRIMQLLATDVDEVLRRMDLRQGASLANTFRIAVGVTLTNGASLNMTGQPEDIVGMYGALDQCETYGEPVQRRLWVNLPQTFNLWRSSDGKVRFMVGQTPVTPTAAAGVPCNECSFVDALKSEGFADILAALESGVRLDVGLSWRSLITAGAETPEDLRTVTLVPDCRSAEDGTYLRWINRRGELSYWLFTNSTVKVTSAVSETFSRHYEGDPAAPVRKGYINPQKANYREAREMTLGATGLSSDEFGDLCDLATSPVVERLVGADQWQRVNVAAGTYERRIRRNTPTLQDMEIIIELPERNTVTL